MAELAKLLTFMFKEDRSEILAHYNELFDNAEDEEALMREFGSPTKLAVTISRTYNRDERKLAVTADSKDDAKPEIPLPVKKPAEPKYETPEVGSYAEIVEEFRRQRALEEGVEYTPIFFDEPEQPAPAEETPAEEEAPVEAAVAEEESVEEAAPAEEESAAEESVEEAPEEEAPVEEKVSADEEAPAEEAPVEDESPAEDAAVGEDAPEEQEEAEFTELSLSDEDAEDDEEEGFVTKTSIPLLILYLIFAIPIGIVGIVLTVVLGAVVIVGAVAAAVVGIKLFAFAFSGLTVFADIFMSGGIALICCAAALLLLWLGVWGMAMGVPGIVRGLKRLGAKLCVREVSVNG